MTTSERSILSEWRVVHDRAERFSERLLFHRERTPFAEIDLLFLDSKSRVAKLIEVKTWSGHQWAQRPVSRTQELRLLRARTFLEARLSRPVQLLLALVRWVGEECEIVYLDFPLEG